MVIDDLSRASVNELLACKGWQNRYKMLLGWSKLLSHKPDIRLDENIVKGCALQTWLTHQSRDNHHYFAVDSDSRIVKGLAVLLLLQMNGKTTQEIRMLDIEALMQELDLAKHLSPSRGNGFKALLDKALQWVEQ